MKQTLILMTPQSIVIDCYMHGIQFANQYSLWSGNVRETTASLVVLEGAVQGKIVRKLRGHGYPQQQGQLEMVELHSQWIFKV